MLTKRSAFTLWCEDVVRYGDVDVQGHVNNVVFATFSESGRVHFLYDAFGHMRPAGSYFVIARLVINYRQEILWPATIAVGTAVMSIGRSSFTLGQGMFFGEQCVATAENVIVLTDERTRRPTALPAEFRTHLQSFSLVDTQE